MRILVLLVALVAPLLSGCAQKNAQSKLAPDSQPPANRTLVHGMGGVELPRATNPHKAFEWRRLAWLDENGQIAPGVLQTALTQRAANIGYWSAPTNRDASALEPADWVFRGPDNIGGRTRSLIIHPTQTNRMWAGAVSGGIWYSEDSGATWTQVNDWLPNLAICCMAMDPNNPNVMYAGTGEGFFNGDAVGGTGIYKSEDGGQTWNLMPATADWDNVCRIAVSPTNSNVLLAARRYYGIFRSTNGGSTWSNRKWAQGSYFVAFDPNNPNKAIAQIIDYDFDNSAWYHAALYSTDGGASWLFSTGLDHVPDFGARIELAYAPSNTNIVYASCAADGGKVWRSTDGGHSYTLRTTSGSSGCNWYANPLWVDPTNPDVLLVGGGHIFRSTDGGVTLQQVSNGYILTEQAHPDIHFFTNDPGFNGSTNRRVYVCTDGGVHRTENVYTVSTTSGWVSLQGEYEATQFYGAAGEGRSGLVYGGTQDNGTLRMLPGSNAANLPFGGDGGFCAVDPTDTNYCYGEYINLQIHRSTNGGVSAGYITNGLADAGNNANFIAPFVLDPDNPNRMYGGGASLWRCDNVKQFSPFWREARTPGSSVISAIAPAAGHPGMVWVGQNDGQIHRSDDATALTPTWTVVDDNAGTNPLPDRYITRIVVDPDDAQTAYVALGGFSPDNLWRTTDGGATWTDITGSGVTGLPDAPIRGLARHPAYPERLYVGTEVGIFETQDGGANWATSNIGPANVSVDEVVFMHNSSILLAATHGRGIFTAIAPAPGDMNCDGFTDNFDIDPFVLALTSSSHVPAFDDYLAQFPDCEPLLADINRDGSVDLFDIDPFVQLLTGG